MVLRSRFLLGTSYSPPLGKREQELYDKNSSTSPLLRLPPEIRNTIWHLVFCSTQIHIENVLGSLSRQVCNHTENDFDRAKSIRNILPQGLPESYTRNHASCTYHPNYKHLFAMTQVCRQIHEETALFSFAEYYFAFFSLASLRIFLDEVLPQQSRAITALSVIMRVQDTRRIAEMLDLMEARLKNLKSVTMFLEDYKGEVKVASNALKRVRTKSRKEKTLPLSSVSALAVAVYNTQGTAPSYVISDSQARKLEAEMENAIKPRSKATQKGEDEAERSRS